MNQISTGAAAHKPAAHPPAAAATVIDIMRTPPATAGQYDHPAAYLTKHPRTTALMIMDALPTSGRHHHPGRRDPRHRGREDFNDVRVHAMKTARPRPHHHDKHPRRSHDHDRQASPSPARRRQRRPPRTDRQHQCVPGIDQRQRRITKARLQIRTGRPSPAAMRQTSARLHNAWFGAAHSGSNEINSTAQNGGSALSGPGPGRSPRVTYVGAGQAGGFWDGPGVRAWWRAVPGQRPGDGPRRS